MGISISQAGEDSRGNAKENIFIAFWDGEYMDNAFVYPTVNRHQTPDTPYLLYMEVNPEKGEHEAEAQRALFAAAMKRAAVLRREKPRLACRVYTGLQPGDEKLQFFLDNGFARGCSIIMERELAPHGAPSLPGSLYLQEFSLHCGDDQSRYNKIYNEIFISPLDGAIAEKQRADGSRNYYLLCGNAIAGSFTLRLDGECGWLDTLFITEGFRGQGYAKLLMNIIHWLFCQGGAKKAMLEVWDMDRRAIGLYEAFGYRATREAEQFPGITLAPGEELKGWDI